MAPDIQEECSATPKSEQEVKPKEEVKPEEEVPRSFYVDNIFSALLFSIVRAVFEESKVRLAEEMVKFRRNIAERMMNRMNDTVNLLKLDESFRAAWNTWLETPPEQKEEEAFKVFESCLFGRVFKTSSRFHGEYLTPDEKLLSLLYLGPDEDQELQLIKKITQQHIYILSLDFGQMGNFGARWKMFLHG